MLIQQKYIILSILLSIWTGFGWAQTPQIKENWVLDKDESSETKNYVARDAIILKADGTNKFRFSATEYGQSFNAKINAKLLFVPTATTFKTAAGVITTNPSEGVMIGAIPGQFAVSPSGGATYNMPIEVPVGINGMQPKISLVYSSQGSNGLGGVGVDLSGLSAIVRVPPSYYYDGKVTPIISQYNQSSCFMLDGMRLFGSNGNYTTEVATYSGITAVGTLNASGQSFKVITKEGLVMEYGNTTDSRTVGGRSLVMAWYLNKTTDLNGNYINYFYKTVDGNTLIDRIEYGKNNNQETNVLCKVSFSYKERTDKAISYQYGVAYTQSQCLDYISTYVNGTILRKYTMGYDVNELTHLKTITLTTGSGKSLAPTVFTWGAPATILVKTTNVELTTNRAEKIFQGDFNGDGRTDIFTIPTKSSYSSSDTWILYFAQTDGSFKQMQTGNLFTSFIPSNSRVVDINGDGKDDLLLCYESSGNSVFKHYISNGTGITPSQYELIPGYNAEMQVGNLEGNGFTNCMLLRTTPKANNNTANIYSVKTIKLNGSPDDNEYVDDQYFRNHNIGGGLVYSPIATQPHYLLDYNGDGKTDIMILNDNGCEIYSCSAVDGMDGKSLDKIYSSSVGVSPKKSDAPNLKFADVNGDGKTDILITNNENTDQKVDPNYLSQCVVVNENLYSTYNNDDGLTYFFDKFGVQWFYSYEDGQYTSSYSPISWLPYVAITKTYIATYFAQGTETSGFLKKDKVLLNTSDFHDINVSPTEYSFVSDFNGDGKNDILESYGIGSGQYKLRLSVGNGFGLFTFKSELAIQKPRSESDFSFGDFNGDGMVDCLFRNSDNAAYQFISFYEGDQKHRVVAIKDGMEQRTDISYRTLNKQLTTSPVATNNYYRPRVTKFQNSSFPVVNAHWPNSEVSRITTYEYYGGNVHREGKGFLGFDITVVKDNDRKVQLQSFNTLNRTLYFMYPTSTKTYNLSGNGLSESSWNYYALTDINNALLYENQLTSETQKDLLSKITTQSSYSNYSYGIPLTTIIITGDIRKTVSRQNTTLSNGVISFIRSTQEYTQYQRMNGSTVVESSPKTGTEYYYGDNGDLYSATENPLYKNNSVVNTYLSPDAFGHPTELKSSIYDVQDQKNYNRTTTQTYTASGRFILSKTNLLGEKTEYKWDEEQGVLESEKSRLGTTSYKYDDFGNLIQTTLPNGIIAAKTVQWATTNDPVVGAVMYRYEETSGSAPVKTWLDKQGRVILTETYGLYDNKKKKYVESVYWPDGKLKKLSEPYFEGIISSDILWNQFEYDDYGRITKETKPSGNAYSTTYVEKVTTKNSPGETTITTLDNAGRILSSNVNGKTVAYEYYPNGLLKNSTPEGGQAVTMRYNLQGKRTRITDPDAGVIRTEYNAWGELYLERQRIHAIGDSISTENIYDKATGLLKSIVRNGETTKYTYDEQYRVSSIEITNKHKQSFVYDNWDRATSTTEVIGNKTFITSRSYDDFGRISRETFPSGYYTENKYDKYSNLIEVKDSKNHNIRTLLEENAKGQTVRVSKGGKITTYGYNALGLTTSIVANNVISLGYSYDAKFNLDIRTETHDGVEWKEQMHYDPINRLSSWTVYKDVVSQQSFSMSYDDQQQTVLGNILTKSSIINGTMFYGGQKPVNFQAPSIVPGPHAISGIKDVLNTNNIIPTNNLAVTYTDFKKIATLSEGNKYYELTYGVDDERRRSIYTDGTGANLTRYYQGNYEQEVDAGGNVREIHYLSGAIYTVSTTVTGVKTENFYYSYTDFQGSLTALVKEDGTIERYAYDPWGARRDPNDWTKKDSRTSWTVNRGYTGHEHLDAFGIINMNGRVYDPVTAQFFSPDPYVQAPGNWLNYNRYAYCYGNPYKYTDPSGEFIVPIIIGAIIGAYIGGSVANSNMDPTKWNFSSGKTWGYMIGGALIGGLSGGLAYGVATSGIPFANTASIMASSFSNSIGMKVMTGGQTDASINFGFGSYNFDKNEWGYIGKNGNKWYDDLGYGLGAMANVSDVLAGFKPGEVQLQTENTSTAEEPDLIGHSQILDKEGKSLIDFGPGKSGEFYQFNEGRNNWINYASDGSITQTKDIPGNLYKQGITIKGVNTTRLASISNNLNKNPGFYNFALRSCSSVAARALTISGVPMFGIHPYLLQLQATLWNAGVRPWTFSYLLTNQYDE